MFTRLLLWRALAALATFAGALAVRWLLGGGPGRALHGGVAAQLGHRASRARLAQVSTAAQLARAHAHVHAAGGGVHAGRAVAALAGALLVACGALLLAARHRARRRRRYVRVRVMPYRTDRTTPEGLAAMFEALHQRVQRRGWRRAVHGQPSLALEVHCAGGNHPAQAWLAVVCPAGMEAMVEAALRDAYPNCSLAATPEAGLAAPVAVLRLRKHAAFIKRVKQLDRFELAREPPVDRLITTMAACRAGAFVQFALTPTPAFFESHAKRAFKRHEAHLARERHEHPIRHDRSLVEDAELRGGLEVQHRPLFFADLRVAGPTREVCEQIASELRAEGAENRLVQRGGGGVRGGARYLRRVARGEGNPWPSWRRAVLASTELCALWHLPSVEYATVPFARSPLPLAPASPAIMRPRGGRGTLCDAYGPVCIHPELRRLNTAVPGTVEQGKSSYLAATVAEDLRRERCAVIVLDPKGDAAEAAVSLVASQRTCTLLDFARPTCGFNPLAVAAPADTIADYVVGALKHLFTDGDIRASSDRYLRNAIIAVLAHDRRASLWDAARLLSVGEEGYAYRAHVAAHLRPLPEFSEIAQFFTAELAAQLADSRSTTTAKLDAPVNKLARLLNSPSIKRVLLNDSLTVDLDRVIARHEVLVVKGALGAMGAGNTAVLMQLLVGMLDAALARQQDRVPADQRVAVALKVNKAPLVLNHGFAETLALKRSAGLETVACWQTDAQWTDREIRSQLDALFAHRVYFATASASDARDAASLMMADFADTIRPEIHGVSALGRPDARLHLPKHHAIVSWTTPHGRQPPFLAQTLPLHVNPARLAHHATRQAARGGRHLDDLSQPHWQRREGESGAAAGAGVGAVVGAGGVASAAAIAGGVPDGRAVCRSGKDGGERGQTSGLADRGGMSSAGSAGSAGTPAGRQAPANAQPQAAASPPPPAKRVPALRAGMTDERAAGAPPAPLAPAVGAELPATAAAPGARASVVARGAPAAGGAPPTPAASALETELPPTAAPSFSELVELDAARRVRWTAAPDAPRRLTPDALDSEILALLAALDHLLTSQIHRRYNATRALTTTQRRLKRLADAGLLRRLQFHRPDGGGAPMCHTIAPAGLALLAAGERRQTPARAPVTAADSPVEMSPRGAGKTPLDEAAPRAARATAARSSDRRLRQVRHDVHVAGWVLAFERALGARVQLVAREHTALSPPQRATPAGRVAIGPGDLRLPGGRTPHDFLRTGAGGARAEVERFETVRPDAVLRAGSVELLIEFDDRLAIDETLQPAAGDRSPARPPAASHDSRVGFAASPAGLAASRVALPASPAGLAASRTALPPLPAVGSGAPAAAATPLDSAVAKLERYDHMLAGWSLAVPRFARRGAPRPAVVFVCRHRARARECARRADRLLCASRAYPGEHPHDWLYPGRTAILFAAERDIHEGLLLAYGVPVLPPAVRATVAATAATAAVGAGAAGAAGVAAGGAGNPGSPGIGVSAGGASDPGWPGIGVSSAGAGDPASPAIAVSVAGAGAPLEPSAEPRAIPLR